MEDKMKWGLVFAFLASVMIIYATSAGDIQMAAAMAVISGLSGATGFAFGVAFPKKK